MQDPALRHQSLGRPLSEAEHALASALESIYAKGTHDFSAVVDELNALGAGRPSGEPGPWTLDIFENELKAINAAHDAAYDADGTGA